jgi:hypothetical protein
MFGARLGPALALAWVLGAPGCKDEEQAPVKAARAFAAAVARADVDAVMSLVEGRALQRLELAAEQASNQVGGRRNIPAPEMMQIVDLDPTFQIGHAQLVSMTADTAQVDLEAADGAKHRLDLVQEEGEWRVKIPVPDPIPQAAGS